MHWLLYRWNYWCTSRYARSFHWNLDYPVILPSVYEENSWPLITHTAFGTYSNKLSEIVIVLPIKCRGGLHIFVLCVCLSVRPAATQFVMTTPLKLFGGIQSNFTLIFSDYPGCAWQRRFLIDWFSLELLLAFYAYGLTMVFFGQLLCHQMTEFN